MIHDTLQANNEALPMVSVIIPVFNTQDYISICLQSVLDQTYPNFEIICIDDGSSDRSTEIIQRMMLDDPRIRLIQIENHGQGYARNLAMNEANGEFVVFLDSDDHLDRLTLDLAVTRAVRDQSDFVVFDWFYYKPIGKVNNYCNKDPFFDRLVLTGDECTELLKISPIFAVNKLYRRSFLDANDIRFVEGYIYEDNPFWVHATLAANKVSLIHSPLYRFTVSQTSSTKTNYNTDFHYKSFVTAITEIIQIFNDYPERASEEAVYSVCLTLFQKFFLYYDKRTPEQYKEPFLKEFVDLFSQLKITDFKRDAQFSAMLEKEVFSRRDYAKFRSAVKKHLIYKPRIKRYKKRIKDALNRRKQKVKRIIKKILRIKPAPASLTKKYEGYLKLPLYEDVILFMGFDYRYTGNSRYLFEEMLKNKPSNLNLFYVTDSPLVPLEYRIAPNSDRCNRFVARSKVVIFESWIPGKYKKRSGATWVQLWHGTPLKKLLYDSNEKTTIQKNPNQKILKFKDIEHWDYLLADNTLASSFFETAFLVNPDRILPYGYPRVRYLIENRNNEALKELIKRKYEIPTDKKIVVYLPTWRDFNYKVPKEEFDLSYLADLFKLQEDLGDEYEIVYKDHPYLSDAEGRGFKNYQEAETQELLLIADVLLTDYSSALFDVLAIDVPIVLLCKDFALNEELRGCYSSIWEDVKAFYCEEEENLAEAIVSAKVDDRYREIKQKYACDESKAGDLGEFIYSLI